jgi:hypothetical protein
MRKLFLLLLLLNLVFFTWARFVAGPGNGSPQPETGAVRRLELASERSEPGRPRCLTVGPFGEQAAERAAGVLRAAQRDAKLRRTGGDSPASYRVVVASTTLERATSTAMRLRAAGVTDLEVVPPGAGAPAAQVSLGIFTDRDRAQRRADDLRRYAVAPTLVEVPRAPSSWWVDVNERSMQAQFDAATLIKLLAAPPDVAVAQCPAGDSGGTSVPAAVPAERAPAAPGSANRSDAKPA